MSVRVKICGITNVEDALAAVAAGADALGFMFYEPSPRNMSEKVAAEITRRLPPFVAKGGVFVDPGEKAVLETISLCGLDTLPFHGDETTAFGRECSPLTVSSAFR